MHWITLFLGIEVVMLVLVVLFFMGANRRSAPRPANKHPEPKQDLSNTETQTLHDQAKEKVDRAA